jgi:PAS domain S-box-containing protein
MLSDMRRRAAQKLADLPLRIKGLLVVAIPLAGLLGVIVAFYFVQRANQDAERWVTHAIEVRSNIQMLHTWVEEAETGVQGYVITRDPRWLEAHTQARVRVPRILERLKRTATIPGQRERLERLDGILRDRLDHQRSLTAAAAAGGRAYGEAELAGNSEHLGLIRNELNALLEEEDELVEQRRAHARVIWDRGYAVIAAGMLFVPAAAVLAMLLFTSGVSRRVQLLDENANRLARGVPISPMRTGKDEIGTLEQSLGEAARLLAERERELREAKEELERRVNERTAELARTNTVLEDEIGERKRAEEGLADAKERLQAIIAASPVAIIGLDLAGYVRSWNHAAETIFGWRADEVLDRPLPTIPDQELRSFHSLLAGTARGETLSGLETRRQRKDGTVIDIRLWTAPIRIPSGEVRGVIGIVADFTEQRRLEQQFSQSQKMEAIGRLAGGVAHDFNNVITIISGYGQMLADGVRHDPILRDAAAEVLKAAERAAGLASQLLAFSRRQVIQPKPVDLNALVANLQRMLSRVIGEDIELQTVLRPDLAPVRADPGQLEQVLMNLVVNARDAMPSGGKLTIETANATLDDRPFVLLVVSDTGVGMDAEVRSHLFEPFFTTKERGKGTGLGLSTVYGIVKQHGGDIWVSSESGRGTTFKIYLPQAAAVAAASAAHPEPALLERGSETVLLVEDEEAVRRLVRDILELQGYRVLEADSGMRALEIAHDYGPEIDLLLTDVVMPGMSGRDLAEALALLRPEIKVLFLSGYTDQVVLEHGVVDAADFLQKPFSPETLARKVRSVLDRDARTAR